MTPRWFLLLFTLFALVSECPELEACKRKRCFTIPCWVRCIYPGQKGCCQTDNKSTSTEKRMVDCPENYVCWCCQNGRWTPCLRVTDCPEENQACFHRDVENPDTVLMCRRSIVAITDTQNRTTVTNCCSGTFSKLRCAMVCDKCTRRLRFALPCEKALGYFTLDYLGEPCLPACPGS
jgi:hypothetical protein